MFSSLLTILIVFLAKNIADGQNVTLEAGELGIIKGFRIKTSQTFRTYFEFNGIPYATDVTGANRFKPSTLREGPLTENGEPFLANNALSICPQSDLISTSYYSSLIPSELKDSSIQAMGLENCLKLNIRSPNLTPEKLLPVILYVHGGSFTGFWSGLFNGGRLMERDVVFVPINYRLGVLGFFNMETDEAPGNAGLYDIVVALKWIQKYIHHFGGDKNLVTIAGQSAGAAAVTHLLVSPLPDLDGLFHRVIAGSGTALLEWATSDNPIPHSLRIAELAGCRNNNETDKAVIVECMQRTATVKNLVDAMDQYTKEDRKNAGLGFGGGCPSVQSSPDITIPKILPESPMKVMMEKRQRNIPLMMGALRHDGSAVLETAILDFLLANNLTEDPEYLKNQLLIDLMKVLGLTDRSEAMIDAVGISYMGNTHYSSELKPKFQGLIDIFSVFFFKAMGFKTIQLHSELNENSYWYSFDFEGTWSLFGLFNTQDYPAGVSHTDDILYLFQFLPLLTPTERAVSTRYIDYHVNFALYGNPNGEGEEVWPKYNAVNQSFLKIDCVDTVGNNYKQDWKNASEGLFTKTTTQPPIQTTTLATTTTSGGSTETTTQPSNQTTTIATTTTSGGSTETTTPPSIPTTTTIATTTTSGGSTETTTQPPNQTTTTIATTTSSGGSTKQEMTFIFVSIYCISTFIISFH